MEGTRVSESLLEKSCLRGPSQTTMEVRVSYYYVVSLKFSLLFFSGVSLFCLIQCINLKTPSLLIFTAISRNWHFICMWAILNYVFVFITHSTLVNHLKKELPDQGRMLATYSGNNSDLTHPCATMIPSRMTLISPCRILCRSEAISYQP